MITDMRAIFESRSDMRVHDGAFLKYSACLDKDGIHYHKWGVAVYRNQPYDRVPDEFVPEEELQNRIIDLNLRYGWYIDGVFIDDVEDWILCSDGIREWLSNDEIIDDIRRDHAHIRVRGVNFEYDELVQKLFDDSEMDELIDEYRRSYVSCWGIGDMVEFFEQYGINAVYLDIEEMDLLNNAHKATIRGTWPC